MIEMDKKFLSDLLAKAADNPRLRQNYDPVFDTLILRYKGPRAL